MDGGSLLITHDDSVQLIRLESALEWRPFPQMTVKQEVLRRVSFDNFFRYLTTDSKQQALEQLRGLLTASYKERFTTVGRDAALALTKSLCVKALEIVKKALPKITDEQNNLARETATQLLQDLTDEKLRAFKQEMVASIQEVLEVRFGNNIREKILGPFQEVLTDQLPLLNSNGSLDALPDGTKFFFSHGRHRIVIVEQKPQVRSVHFSRNFIGGVGRFNLAFPYVIFLIVFTDQQFDKLYLYYANRPLTSLNNQVFRCNLPNIDHHVCLGFNGCRQATLTGQVEEIIAYFWQSRFNNDLSAGYRRMARRGGAFRDLTSWEAASQKDPLFVLRVDWEELSSNFTLNSIVSLYLKGSLAEKITNFNNLITEALNTDGINIGALARKCCEVISIDKRYPKKAINALREQITLITEDITREMTNTLAQLTESPDEQALMTVLNQVTAEAVDQTIAQDFDHYANQVLLRRNITCPELIQRIVNQP